jgi:hypothetical protein
MAEARFHWFRLSELQPFEMRASGARVDERSRPILHGPIV